MKKLKQKLLATGYFIDNQFLDDYLQLVLFSDNNTFYTEAHHILPRSYFKLVNLKCDNSESNLVKLSYFNHCKAHFLLANCTVLQLRHSNILSLRIMTKSKRAKLEYLNEAELDQVKIYNDNNSLFWRPEENAIIIEKYPTMGTACIKYLPDRTKRAIKCQAKKLGIKFDFENSANMKRYSKEENEFLIKNYAFLGIRKCAEILNRPYQSVKSHAAKTLKIAAVGAPEWSESEITILVKLYPIYGAEALTEYLPGRNALAIRKKAHRLGIKWNRYPNKK